MNRVQASGKSRATWIIPLLLLGSLAALYFLWPDFNRVVAEGYRVLTSEDEQRVESWVSGFGAYGYLAILGLMLLQTIVAFLPSILPMVIAVLAYGPFLGGALAWGGLMVAATLGYGIGRAFGPVTVDRMLGHETEQKVERMVERYGLWAIIAARISPVLSTDAVSIVAGLVKMSFPRFLLATGAGTIPLTILIAILGADIQRLKTGLIVISAVSVAIFVGYVIYDRRRMVQPSTRRSTRADHGQ